MADERSRGHWMLRGALPFFLAVQAGLLFYRLDLLPIWGDEFGTLRLSAMPLRQIPGNLTDDVHPPLYYFLVHIWLQMPWFGSALAGARALSAVAVLGATVALDRLWLKDLDRSARLTFLLLWTFSPCLILYGRMARPYSLQLLVGVAGLYAAARWFREPARWLAAAGYAAASACLLYIHYAPGLALIGGTSLALLWKAARNRKLAWVGALAAGNALIAILYLPWLWHLLLSVSATAEVRAYSPTPNPVFGHLVRLGYWFASFSFGESFADWGIVAAACVAPALAWFLIAGLRRAAWWLAIVAPVAVVGYIGVTQWVSFAFVPARLLFLLPFFFLLLVHGRGNNKRAHAVAIGALLCVWAGSLYSYFRAEGFLNKGYVVPNEQIAAMAGDSSSAKDALFLADAYTSLFGVMQRLPPGLRVIQVGGVNWRESLDRELKREDLQTIWYVRNTRDYSPGRLNERLEAELASFWEARRHFFVRYSSFDRLMMRVLGWRERPSHYLQMLEMRRKAEGSR